MKLITISLPETVISALDKLADLGVIPNRSQGIRIAVQYFLKPESHHYAEIRMLTSNRSEK